MEFCYACKIPLDIFPHKLIRRLPSAVKRNVAKVFYIYRKLFANSSQRTVSVTLQDKPQHTEIASVLSGMSRKETSGKNFRFARRKIDKE